MIVLDSSVVLKWLAPEEAYANVAVSLLSAHLFGYQKIAVPFILFGEALVTLRKWGWPSPDIEDGLGLFFSAELELIPPSLKLLTKAAGIAEQTKRPRRETFDCIFLAAALMYHAPLVTADETLFKYASTISGLKVYHLKDFNKGLAL